MQLSLSICFALIATTLIAAKQKICAAEPSARTHELDHGNARVVLVGDSITGLSRNASAGFAHQMDWALKQAYPNCQPQIISLGGSGQGVYSWSSTEKRSRTEEFFLDVKGIPVKATLDQHADVLVIMLGMNDVLAPYVVDESESLQKWTDTYRSLIQSLQVRLTPKVTALATPTLCTEDIHSPKNRMMDKLCERVAALADELHLLVLPTNATMREVLAKGRSLKWDFHVTYDYVHPNEAGQLAIAMGMLDGLGCWEAARKLERERMRKLMWSAHHSTPLAYRFPLGYVPWKFLVREDTFWEGFCVPPFRIRPAVEAPDPSLEWPFIQENFTGEKTVGGFGKRTDFRKDEGLFTFGLPGDNPELERQLRPSMLWNVAAGLMRPKAWKENKAFDPALAHGPVEDAIEQGRILDAPIDMSDGKMLAWQLYHSTINYTGGDAPGSVDFAAVTHAQNFEGGVAARAIHSWCERPVRLELGTQAFAGIMHLTVYLNGHVVYSGLITSEPKKHKTVDAVLRKGRNILAFTLDHVAWQMQCSVDLRSTEGGSLDDSSISVNDFDPW